MSGVVRIERGLKFFSLGSLKLEQPVKNAIELTVTIANAEMRESDVKSVPSCLRENPQSYSERDCEKSQSYSYE